MIPVVTETKPAATDGSPVGRRAASRRRRISTSAPKPSDFWVHSSECRMNSERRTSCDPGSMARSWDRLRKAGWVCRWLSLYFVGGWAASCACVGGRAASCACVAGNSRDNGNSIDALVSFSFRLREIFLEMFAFSINPCLNCETFSNPFFADPILSQVHQFALRNRLSSTFSPSFLSVKE